MPDDSPEHIHKHVSKAFDRMVQSGWISSYARRPDTGYAVNWTERGKQSLQAIYIAQMQLGPMDKDLWWAVGTIADMKFGPGGPSSFDLGEAE